jgi:hypothetical protein
MKEEFVQKIHPIGDAYQYSIQDLRRSAMTGTSLDSRRAATARRVIENKIDKWGATGMLTGGIAGALNHPNIPLVVPPTGTWSGATALQMLADLEFLVNSVIDNNEETFFPDTIILDGPSLRRIASTPMLDNSSRTVLQTFLQNNLYITRIEGWYECKLADAAGTGPRFMCYKRDPEVITFEIPQEFEQFPPQAVNLAFKVPCHARVAGIAVPYPLACGYMDGC